MMKKLAGPQALHDYCFEVCQNTLEALNQQKNEIKFIQKNNL